MSEDFKNPALPAPSVTPDREEKLQLVIENLTPHCNAEANYEDLRRLSKGLNMGDKIIGKILTGGYSNYTYKLYLENNPEVSVFAKLGFTEFLYSDDKELVNPLDRLDKEVYLMKKFAGKALVDGDEPAPVVTPYLVMDIGDGMRMFVTEWAKGDIHLGDYVTVGDIDMRVIRKLAVALARINLTPIDDEYRCAVAESSASFRKAWSGFDRMVLDMVNRPDDRAVLHARNNLGKERIGDMLRAWRRNDTDLDPSESILAHADPQLWNIMVEGKQEDGSFGPEALLYLCDWEQSRAANPGYDVAVFILFPIEASFFLAANGHIEEAKYTLHIMKSFWEIYSTVLVTEGEKNKEYLTKVFRGSMGVYGYLGATCGYSFEAFKSKMKQDDLSPADVREVMAALCLHHLLSWELGFMDDVGAETMTLEELHECFFGFADKEILDLYDTIHLKLSKTDENKKPTRQLSLSSGLRDTLSALQPKSSRRLSSV